MSQELMPDPFQDHPEGNWEAAHRPKAIEAIERALRRYDAGEVTMAELRSDKNPQGIKFWLWFMQHPPNERWKKIGRPYWSADAYATWRRQFLQTPEEKRFHRDGRPALCTLPRRAAGEDWLIHEHVVPQKVLLDWLISRLDSVVEVLAHNIGAVITRREDRRLPSRSSHVDPRDPWRRYAGTGIQFVSNPRWTAQERRALEKYDLVAADCEHALE